MKKFRFLQEWYSNFNEIKSSSLIITWQKIDYLYMYWLTFKHIRDTKMTASIKAADTMVSIDRWGPRFCKQKEGWLELITDTL